jgi:WD40 repeat protein
MNAQNTQTFNAYSPVQCILLLGDRIVSGSARGFDMIQISTAESIVSLEEYSVAYAIEASDSRIFSGHFQGVINARDLNILTILDIYQGHQDVVSSICIDLNGVLYSASYDGSIKKWNMAARKVAFSFENREASVTAMAVSRSFLFVGTRRVNAIVFKSVQLLIFTLSITTASR